MEFFRSQSKKNIFKIKSNYAAKLKSYTGSSFCFHGFLVALYIATKTTKNTPTKLKSKYIYTYTPYCGLEWEQYEKKRVTKSKRKKMKWESEEKQEKKALSPIQINRMKQRIVYLTDVLMSATLLV